MQFREVKSLVKKNPWTTVGLVGATMATLGIPHFKKVLFPDKKIKLSTEKYPTPSEKVDLKRGVKNLLVDEGVFTDFQAAENNTELKVFKDDDNKFSVVITVNLVGAHKKETVRTDDFLEKAGAFDALIKMGQQPVGRYTIVLEAGKRTRFEQGLKEYLVDQRVFNSLNAADVNTVFTTSDPSGDDLSMSINVYEARSTLLKEAMEALIHDKNYVENIVLKGETSGY